jgi:ubiquinone/menaquinone biosynthesis C-methylase UbiE
MNIKSHKILFNIIAPGYNWFFKSQTRNYAEILSRYIDKLEIQDGGRILDVGCGTGALTKVLAERGFEVTGIDISGMMTNYGKKRGLECRHGDIIEGLDFKNKSFDLVTFAYVAHGLDRDKRKQLFIEAERLSRGKILFHEYSSKRNVLTDIIEFIEGGEYFNFIRTGLEEMQEIFSSVEVVEIKKHNNWYICTP